MPDYTLTKEFDQKLGQLTNDTPSRSKGDVITRAVTLYEYLHKQIAGKGNCYVAIVEMVTEPDGYNIVEVIKLP